MESSGDKDIQLVSLGKQGMCTSYLISRTKASSDYIRQSSLIIHWNF